MTKTFCDLCQKETVADARCYIETKLGNVELPLSLKQVTNSNTVDICFTCMKKLLKKPLIQYLDIFGD